MARALRLTRTAGVLGVLQVVQWLAVAALARSSSADDAGAGLLVLQVGLLLPLALVSVYALVAAISDARLGLCAAALWALGPFAVAPLWDGRYRGLYEDRFLAPLVGLTHEPGFRAAVLVTAALALTALALRRESAVAAAAAGLAASAAAWADASAVIALGVPALALLAGRRRGAAAAALAGVVPGAIALALAGDLPSFPTSHAAWSHLDANELGFQEYFWSMRLLQWLPLAGALGLARRSVPLALALLAVVAGWLIVEGSSVGAQVSNGTFLPALLPAAPAYCALAAGIVLLVPPLRIAKAQPSTSR
ncbi:MAG: hypothetical protein ACXVZ4_06440 [Gaiellaceae bacterium]